METKNLPGFQSQRTMHLSADVIERCKILQYVKDCYLTSIGRFLVLKNNLFDSVSMNAEFILIFCIGGSGYCQLDNQVWNLSEGSMLIIPANIACRYIVKEESPLAVYWLQVSGEVACQFLANLGDTESQPVLEVTEIIRITDCFERLFYDLQLSGSSPIYTDEALLLLSTTLMHMLAILLASKKSSELPEKNIEQRIFRSIHYMKINVTRVLTLEHLADNVNMSSSHYSALFKQHINNSPIAFFNNLKMQHACELFNSGKSNIALVASNLGFEDSFYFSRIFKKIVGVTPSKYIKRSK